MNKSQEKTIFKMRKLLTDIEVFLSDFQNDCIKNIKSSYCLLDEQPYIEKCIELSKNAIKHLNATTTEVKSICNEFRKCPLKGQEGN